MLLFLSMAWGADYYADPVNGSAAGDGSAADPWGSLEEIVAAGLFEVSQWDAFPYVEGTSVLVPRTAGPIGPGDTLWLRDGHHGEALIDSAYVEGGTITIAAVSGAHPTLSRVRFRSAQGFVLRGVTVSPSFAPSWSTETLVDLDSHSWTGPVRDITIEDCELYSVIDSSAWTAADWNTLAPNGVQADGTDITLRGNHLLNVNFGLSVSADHSLVERNVVENFAGDGMRGLGDFTTFQYNTVMNCYDVNDNHDDGFQSWSVGPGGVGTGEVTGIVLRGNVILNYVDENQPLRGPLQGIGCFDGTFVDWVIEDNVVVTDHWHGITLLGARGVRVVNNTVVDRNSVSPGPPWISIDDH
ncbi:MAG: right-handed parallel beta-helix repeat-containing protein, partial [Myxococcales bacterium]|nr:right-handed parallel beta-helix repeat-containing protein [Myxococcales bacterium]